MNKHIYWKLALTDLKKNTKVYVPYLLTFMGSMLFYYILLSLSGNPAIYDVNTKKEGFYGAATLCSILRSGCFVAAFFSFIFLLYANSFVQKQQKKQLGLYRVLGMERRHVAAIIVIETILLFSVGLITALFFGILFDKLLLLLLLRIIRQEVSEGFFLNTNAIYHTFGLTLWLTLIILLCQIFSISRTKDIDLLKSDHSGEHEPKSRLLLTLFGLVLTGVGYYLTLTSQNTLQSIQRFFPAAFSVILGTYALFIAGSIAILKLLKKNRNFYYHTRHFISVSGMLYRMKQNAAGLATICILSSAAIVVISAAVCLYSQGEHSISQRYPRSVQMYLPYEEDLEQIQVYENYVKETAHSCNTVYEDFIYCNYANSVFHMDGNTLSILENVYAMDIVHMPDTYVMTLQEYNRFHNTTITLGENEILLYDADQIFPHDTLEFEGHIYQIKEAPLTECLTYIKNYSMSLFSTLLIVVPDRDTFYHFLSETFKEDTPYAAPVCYMGINMDVSAETTKNFADKLQKTIDGKLQYADITLRTQEEIFFYNTYGGLFFVGIVLGILFLICTVMIIYYKQISEGYHDRERFLIMQKVGLSKKEIKQAIHSQVMLLFFLPLVTAIIHSAVALHIVANCLKLVMIVHLPTFVISVAVTCMVFALVYGIVYKITSGEYYRIVNE